MTYNVFGGTLSLNQSNNHQLYTEQFCLLINGGIFSLHFWQQCLLFICFVFAFYDVSSLACFSVAVS